MAILRWDETQGAIFGAKYTYTAEMRTKIFHAFYHLQISPQNLGNEGEEKNCAFLFKVENVEKVHSYKRRADKV